MSKVETGAAHHYIQQEGSISRRSLITKVGKTAAVGLVTGPFIADHDKRIAAEGIQTASGIFYPIYERHDIGITLDQIPHGLDILYKENGASNGWVKQNREYLGT
jgi:hypothetical protein